MTWYDLHRCVYDLVRSQESHVGSTHSLDGYELTDVERKAVEDADVASLHVLGLHGVLLNRYCRHIGLSREEYRAILAPFEAPGEGVARWQS